MTARADEPLKQHIDAEESLAGSIAPSLLFATWALFLGLGMLLIGAGVFGTLVSVRAELDGFSALSIGLIGSAYYGGFVVGSRLVVKALGQVGHIRVYGALASVMASTIIGAGFFDGPAAWIGARLIVGACLAGQYVVAESWLNQLVSNQRRGQLLATYLILTNLAYGFGQWIFGFLDPATLAGFGLAAALTSLAVAPVALSEEARPPTIARGASVSFREVWALVPTGFVTSLLVGVSHGAFLGLGAVYATRSGVSIEYVGLFVATPTLGNLILTVPTGAMSDRIDRRVVGFATATLAAGGGLLLVAFGAGQWPGWLAMALIGGLSFPLYSVAGAYTNDHCPPHLLTAAASQLVLLFGAGAFLGPLVGSFAMSAIGVSGFAWTIVVSHLAIALFLAVRVAQYPTAVRADPERAVRFDLTVADVPATAVGSGRRVRLPQHARQALRRARRRVATGSGRVRGRPGRKPLD